MVEICYEHTTTGATADADEFWVVCTASGGVGALPSKLASMRQKNTKLIFFPLGPRGTPRAFLELQDAMFITSRNVGTPD